MYYDSNDRVIERQYREACRTELKPCPFCGGKPEIVHSDGRRGNYQKYICEWRIYCEIDKYELKAYEERRTAAAARLKAWRESQNENQT